MNDHHRFALERELEHARATVARLEQTLGTAGGDDMADLVPLKAGAAEFGVHLDTARRWVTERGMGRRIGGRLHLSRRAALARDA